MAKIIRDPVSAAKVTYDLIVLGGGIYGAMLSLEASRRRLRPLLLERDDFGAATSFNSLRIVHGGLRYLQNLDLHRFRESVSERRWFLKTFPGLVKPMPCLMPLYGRGLYRPSVLRAALCLNDVLSRKRNQDVHPDRHLPPGKVIDANQTRAIFPSVDECGLKGGAIWHDACMPDSQRLLVEILRWACTLGATTLNYVEAQELVKNNQDVVGVMAVDRESGGVHEYRARIVVNAAGPWCRAVAARFHQDEPALFKPSIAWNVLFKKEALSDHALAVTPKKPGGRTYFMVPWKGKLFVGTGHAPWFQGTTERPRPSTEQLQGFLNDLNLAVPGLELSSDDILRFVAGLLPTKKIGTTDLTTREVILNHADYGGPQGLYSISGIKFTTARLVAEKTLNQIFPERRTTTAEPVRDNFKPPESTRDGRGLFPFDWHPDDEDTEWKNDLRMIIDEESAQHLDDLIMRRTSLWDSPSRAIEVASFVSKLFDWDESRCHKEIERLIETISNSSI